MRIDTFRGQAKKMLFMEDGDSWDRIKAFMIENQLTGIVISRYLGFTGDSIALNDSFEFVDEVHIIDSNVQDISFLYSFPSVKVLNIQNNDKTKIDFAEFEYLEDIFITWRRGVQHLMAKQSLKSLKIEKYKEKSLDFSGNENLETLWIYPSPLERLVNCQCLSKLKNLKLARLSCMVDTSWLQYLTHLEFAYFVSCKKMSSTLLDSLLAATNLKRLYLERMGDIPSINSIQSFANIEDLAIIDTTRIVDGDLTPLLALPKSCRILVRSYNHYRPSFAEIEASRR